jgi:signal transduction histidine kinase
MDFFNSYEQYTLAFVAIANFLLGVIVYLRNPRLYSSISFLLMTVSVLVWCFGLIMFYASGDSGDVLFSSRVYYIGALWMNTFLLLFTIYFCHIQALRKLRILPLMMSIIMSIYIALSDNFFIQDIVFTSNGSANISTRDPQYLAYVTLVIGYYAINLIVFLATFKRSQGINKSRLGIMLLGFLFAGVFASYYNLYLPLLDDYSLVWVGPVFLLLFVALFTYAILRLRLFDIRLVVAKSFGYALTVLTIIVIPVATASLLFDSWFIGISDLARAAVVTVFYLISLSAFGPTKRMVDLATKRIFYRDSYNTQNIIDQVSGITVSEYDVDLLIQKSTTALSNAIKPGSGRFILLDSSGEFYSDYKINIQVKKIRSSDAIDHLRIQTEQIFSVEDFESSGDPALGAASKIRLHEYLKSHQIGVSVKLSTSDEIVGYMLLGNKLSGALYSKQDKELLGIAANELAVAIQNARRFDEISRFNETLQLEIDRATKELRDSNEKLQALDQAKDEFVSMASHQLRTPLTSVKGYLSMVLEGDVGEVDKQQRDLLAAAFSSSQRMVYLIADLLNVSRLQTGKFVIEPMLTDLPMVVESEIDQLKETANAKKLKVNFKKPKNFPQLYLDETKTRQVIMNFIDNAIYYTPAGGEIEVKLHADDKKIEYTVIDNGIGVPRSEQKNMFTKFYRASNAKKARPDGTGLGLFMAKKVIIDQGGALIFHSKEGNGSTFGFTFPLSRVRPPKKLLKDKESGQKAKKSKKSSATAKKSPRKKSK